MKKCLAMLVIIASNGLLLAMDQLAFISGLCAAGGLGASLLSYQQLQGSHKSLTKAWSTVAQDLAESKKNLPKALEECESDLASLRRGQDGVQAVLPIKHLEVNVMAKGLDKSIGESISNIVSEATRKQNLLDQVTGLNLPGAAAVFTENKFESSDAYKTAGECALGTALSFVPLAFFIAPKVELLPLSYGLACCAAGIFSVVWGDVRLQAQEAAWYSEAVTPHQKSLLSIKTILENHTWEHYGQFGSLTAVKKCLAVSKNTQKDYVGSFITACTWSAPFWLAAIGAKAFIK